MPMFKVYLGNLDLKVTAETLKPLFEPFGDGDEIVIATDEEGKSRGFAIILFKDPLKGQLAVETLAGRKISGRTVVINEAIKKGKKTQPAERMPRNTPLGPRAFPRGGGFGRVGGGGTARSNASGGRFIRNPRRLLHQTGPTGALPSAAAVPPGPAAPPATAFPSVSGTSVPPASPGASLPPSSAAPVAPAAHPARSSIPGSTVPVNRASASGAAARPSRSAAGSVPATAPAPATPAASATPTPKPKAVAKKLASPKPAADASVPPVPPAPVRPKATKKTPPPVNP